MWYFQYSLSSLVIQSLLMQSCRYSALESPNTAALPQNHPTKSADNEPL
jgi:hypothetical protein